MVGFVGEFGLEYSDILIINKLLTLMCLIYSVQTAKESYVHISVFKVI